MIPENVKKLIVKGNIIQLATSSKKGVPNLISVECCGLIEDKILIADCQLNKTLKNIKENNKAAVLLSDNKDYFQIKGEIEHFTSGSLFSKVVEMNKNTDFKPKGAITFTCKEIYDLNSCTKLL